MNVFEGARRITAIAAPVFAIAVGFAIHSEYRNPYVQLSYEVESTTTPPKRNSGCTSNPNAMEVIDRETQSGNHYRVILCFKAQESSDGRLLVPYRDGDKIFMNEWFLPDVGKYTTLFAHNFKASAEEMQEAEDSFADARNKNRVEVAAAIVGIPLLSWSLAWAIGWAVRGFLGIPRGQDHRPKTRRDSSGPLAPQFNSPSHAVPLANDEEFNAARDLVGRFMTPQIEELKRNGENIPINNVSFVYILTLASCLAKKGFTLHQVRKMIEYFHPDSSRAGAENALLLIGSNPSDFREKCVDMIPIVNAEVASGKGEFFVKYTRKANKQIERMFEGADFDPRTAKPINWLEV